MFMVAWGVTLIVVIGGLLLVRPILALMSN
jgi:hypothetical protein